MKTRLHILATLLHLPRHRTFVFKISVAVAVGLVASGCASPIAQRAQRADGLLGFIFDQPGADIVPVERVQSHSGQVATAHATPDRRGGLRVSGLVRRNSIVQPRHGAHVDVFIVDARGKIIASTATDYLPRQIPRAIRGGFGQSHYTARIPTLPPAGATVQVRFHSGRIAECEHAPGA